MPMNRKLYPENWRQISHFIRFERAAGKCEECGVPHGALRSESGDWWLLEDLQDWFEWQDMTVGDALATALSEKGKIIEVVLTTAHLGIAKPDGSPGDRSDTMDCRPENLKALCQRCHLAFDRADNINRRRINRRKKLVSAGQLEMFV